MKFQKLLLLFSLAAGLIAGSHTSSLARDTVPGGPGGSTCNACTYKMSLGMGGHWECGTTWWIGGTGPCEFFVVPNGLGCRETGSTCGIFWPSPNPVVF